MEIREAEKLANLAANSFYSNLRLLFQPGSDSYQEFFMRIYASISQETGISPENVKYVLGNTLEGAVNNFLRNGGIVVLPKPSNPINGSARGSQLANALLEVNHGSYIAERLENVQNGKVNKQKTMPWNFRNGYINSLH